MDKLVDPQFVLFDVAADGQTDVVHALAERFLAAGRIDDLDGYVNAVLERERTSSTAVGFSVATPHAKTDFATHATIGFARLAAPLQWDDEEEVDLVFLLAVPMKDAGDRHLKILAALFRKLVDDDFRETIRQATSPEQVVALIDDIS